MNELIEIIKFQAIELLLDEIFNCLDIMIGCLLNILYFLCMEFGEILIDPSDIIQHVNGKVFQFGEGCREGDEIFDLYLNAVTHQAELGEIRSEGFNRFEISAINGRDCCEWI
jgi:hypothetical protein